MTPSDERFLHWTIFWVCCFLVFMMVMILGSVFYWSNPLPERIIVDPIYQRSKQ